MANKQLETISNITHPSRFLISGTSGSGKTQLAVELILSVLAPLTDRRIIVCPTFSTQEVFRHIDHLVNYDRDVFEDVTPQTFSIIYNQILAQQTIAKQKGIPPIRTLLFIDDCGSDKAIHGGRVSQFGKLAIQLRPLKVSSIVTVQNPKLVSPNYRENANHFIFFPSDNYEVLTWMNNQYNGTFASKEVFLKLIKKAWNGGMDYDYEYGEHFLYISAQPRTKKRYYSDFNKEITVL